MLVINFRQLPLRAIEDDTICIKINQQEYELDIEESKKHAHGHLLLYKGDKPAIARELHTKLSSIWKNIGVRRLILFVKDFMSSSFQIWLSKG